MRVRNSNGNVMNYVRRNRRTICFFLARSTNVNRMINHYRLVRRERRNVATMYAINLINKGLLKYHLHGNYRLNDAYDRDYSVNHFYLKHRRHDTNHQDRVMGRQDAKDRLRANRRNRFVTYYRVRRLLSFPAHECNREVDTILHNILNRRMVTSTLLMMTTGNTQDIMVPNRAIVE